MTIPKRSFSEHAPTQTIRRILAAIVHGRASPDDSIPAEVVASLDSLRLLPLLHACGRGDNGPTAERLAASYRNTLARNAMLLDEGVRVMAALTAAGVPSLGLRGPFAAAGLYGDIGARACTDIDIMIRQSDKPAAWRALTSLSYELSGRLWRGFYDRHHLEWPMRHSKRGIPLDVHWAIDHPYRPYRVNYEDVFRRSVERHAHGLSWMEPCPEHVLLLSCLHAAKETGALGPESWDSLVGNGKLIPWLDAALLVQKHSRTLDWPDILITAEQWVVERPVAAVLRAAAAWFDIFVPPLFTERSALAPNGRRATTATAATSSGPAWFRRLFAFRASRAKDLFRYVFPPASFVRPDTGAGVFRRANYAARSAMRVLLLAFDSIRGLFRVMAWRSIRRVMGAAIAITLAGPAQAHEFGDDAGDGPASALNLDGAGGGRFTLEIDTDEDWFSFTALPETTYTVTVSRVGIYDGISSLENRYGSPVNSNSSLPSAGSYSVACSNGGPLARFYVSVHGYLAFTTGSYDVAVVGGFVDTDSDGMPDRWEQRYFGNLDQTASGDKDSDGGANLAEYYCATCPTNPESCLRITDLNLSTQGATVAWQAVSSGWYRVVSATNLTAVPAWRALSTNRETGSISRQYSDTSPAAATSRFYRVELVY